MQKWDYTALVYPATETQYTNSFLGSSLKEMKALGQEGWELVTVVYTGPALVCYYRRPFQVVGEHTNPNAPVAPRDL
jgi:hypothetical protein